MRRRGGLATNTYASPIYSADVELVVIAEDLGLVLDDLRAVGFRMEELPVSVNAQRSADHGAGADHNLVVQFMRPKLHQPFVERSTLRPIFGLEVPVASLADVVQGLLWTYGDSTRRESRRAKDQLDLLRLAEVRPAEVEPLLPPDLRAEAIANRTSRLQQPSDGWDD